MQRTVSWWFKNRYSSIFPWQKYATSTPTSLPSTDQFANRLTPSQIVYHDHHYCSSNNKPLYSPSTCTGSSYLILIVATDILHLNTSTAEVSTNTQTLLYIHHYPLALTYLQWWCHIQFYTGFQSYNVLIICFRFLYTIYSTRVAL